MGKKTKDVPGVRGATRGAIEMVSLPKGRVVSALTRREKEAHQERAKKIREENEKKTESAILMTGVRDTDKAVKKKIKKYNKNR